MKTLLLSLFSALTLAGFPDRPEKLGADYQITKSAPDRNFSKTEAAFAFTFLAPGGKPIKTEIMYSYNKINKKEKPDANGKIMLKVKPGKYVFQFFSTIDYNEIYVDSIQIKPT